MGVGLKRRRREGRGRRGRGRGRGELRTAALETTADMIGVLSGRQVTVGVGVSHSIHWGGVFYNHSNGAWNDLVNSLLSNEAEAQTNPRSYIQAKTTWESALNTRLLTPTKS